MKLHFILLLLCLTACSESRQTGDVNTTYHNIAPAASTLAERHNPATPTSTWPDHFGFGKVASKSDIGRLDIDIMPNGHGLPTGRGTATDGQAVYRAKCASCHGINGNEGPNDVLISKDKKSIGTYWPYATTLFDYIRRAMPFTMPGSLTDEEVYQLTAYLLAANGVIDSATIMDKKTLPNVVMPAKAQFVLDDRQGGPEIK